MQPSSKRALGVAALLILALIAYLALRQPPVPDQDQIAAQLQSAAAAAQSHNSDGIMQIVSEDFKGPGPISNTTSLHFFLGRILRDTGAFQVAFSPPNVVVTGDTATSTSRLTVRDRQTGQTRFDQPVTLNWRREDGRRLLFLPTKVWRVVGTTYQGQLPGGDE